jgi:glycosyltransferase involved in cell wall biosynthesis
MGLTIGMASYNNAEQVWWTIQALRFYHDLTDCEILVVDNYGDDSLQNKCAPLNAKYIRYTDKRGTAIAKEQVFKNASGDFVLCIDSHVMLSPNSIADLKKWINENKDCPDLIHGAMVYDHLTECVDRMEPVWRTNMYGIWGKNIKLEDLPATPYEIPMHGGGCIGSFKDKWLHYNEQFTGFGGEEGYIHEKYRKAGHKVLCLPFLRWLHRFHDQLTPTPYHNSLEERISNYVIGWTELGLSLDPIKEHFKSFKIDIQEENNNRHINISKI